MIAGFGSQDIRMRNIGWKIVLLGSTYLRKVRNVVLRLRDVIIIVVTLTERSLNGRLSIRLNRILVVRMEIVMRADFVQGLLILEYLWIF